MTLRKGRSLPKIPLRPQLVHLEGREVPAAAFVLSNNSLIAFDTANPGAATAPVAITGVLANETIAGIDIRPQNGQLYGLGVDATADTASLYAISARTGVATLIGTGSFTGAGDLPDPATAHYGLDFNPAVDRLRVTTSKAGAVAAGLNFRVNPVNGTLVAADTDINPAGQSIDEVAYTNNIPNNGNITTLYALSSAQDTLSIQNPPNGGLLTLPIGVTLGGNPLDITAVNGFDIPSGVNAGASNAAVTSGTAFAVLDVSGTTKLYSIDLVTAKATAIGAIAGATAVQGFAIQSTVAGLPAIGLANAGTSLVRFNTSTPGTSTTVTISGITAGELLVGIDFRPATGQLYGFGVNTLTKNGTLYNIDPQLGTATVVGTAGSIAFSDGSGAAVNLPDPVTTGYGFDFNPTVDRIRVTTSTGLNFRLNPVSGLPIDGDLGGSTGSVSFVNTDAAINGGAVGASGAAYTNSYGQGAGGPTTLYTLDGTTNKLFIQNPPNAGTETNGVTVTLNGTELDFTNVNGFDIAPGVQVATSNSAAAGVGYASLDVGGVTNLYSIDLTTGAATLIGAAPLSLFGLAVGDGSASIISFSAATYSFSEAGPTADLTLTRTGSTTGSVSVTVNLVTGTAGAGDFTTTPIIVTFADGASTATAKVPLTNDSTPEPNETFTANLSNATNGALLGGISSAVVTIANDDSVAATLIGSKQFSAGTDSGGNTAILYNADGTVRFTLTPFPGQAGGLRTAAADFNGDGIADLVVGTGPSAASHVKVFDGVTKAELFTVDPFEAAFTGGVYVSAGDINGDGKAELVISPDEGGGPRVRVFNGNGFTQIADFFGIDDPNFRGGARTAVGDINGDTKADLVVAAGFGGGPRIAAYDGSQLITTGGPKLFGDFFAFESTLRNGAFIASGDVNGDGFADVVAGGGPGGGPRVYILSGRDLVLNGSDTLVPVGNFFAGDVNSRGGIRVAVKNLDNDGKADIVTGAGTGTGSRVTAYLGTNITPTGGTPTETLGFDAVSGFTGGVFVG